MSPVRDAVQNEPVEIPANSFPGTAPDPIIRQKHGLIGAPVSRLDGPLKVTGAAPFAAEFDEEHMVFAALAYSSIAKGRIGSLDTSKAEAAPGVVLVMTHRNAPKMKPTPPFLTSPKACGPSDLPIMQDDTIHWNGETVAVVLAGTQEQADYAKSLIRVTYAAEPGMVRFDDAKAHARFPETVLGEPSQIEQGDAESALAAAPFRVDQTFRTPHYNHNAIELHAVTLFWKNDELFIHDASQAVRQTAWTLADVFGLKEEQIHVSSPYVGGGFGGKTLWHHHVLAAAASRLAQRPVRMVLSREGVYRTVGGRTTTEQRVAIGADAEGRFQSIIHTGVAAMTAHNNCPEQFTFPARHLYAARNFKIAQQVADMDMVANTFMRAPGESIGTFALESAIDELAEKLSLDPIELRKRNEPEADPVSGKSFSSRNLVEAYRAGAETFGWEKRNRRPGADREGEWLIGMGCATATYPYMRMPGGGARITLTRDGCATIDIAAHEMGMGTSTTHALVAAQRLGIAMECINVNYGDSDLAGMFLAGGSSQTASIGASIIAAQRQLVKQLLDLAGAGSPLHGLSLEQIAMRNGGLCQAADPRRWESYAAILQRAGREQVVAKGEASPPEEMEHWSMHSFGAMFAEVRVNGITGETRVSRFLGSFDCGRILNPKTAASQFRGGIIMGLGLALMEETQFDERNGRIMNPSLAEYHLPVHMDVPPIDIIWTDIPDPHTPMGARGIGEIGITGTGAAVANAIYNACGKRIRELPITLDKLF
ncbi:MAG TPA: xanthine dehydrogenase family protein molybdopterin-binding subunit [Acidobacteriaceae bacterium]|jgi:xanthine dehydrogenase YagR molybdenum-binding subunit|nr:xanthine dehydrogenase family protein molybdopterin-binding subunit [Acidobacteriaceae bacterium]